MKHLWGKCWLRKGEKGMQVTSYLLMYVLEVSILAPQRTACQWLNKPQMYFYISKDLYFHFL